jgi:hypothetical protein
LGAAAFGGGYIHERTWPGFMAIFPELEAPVLRSGITVCEMIMALGLSSGCS